MLSEDNPANENTAAAAERGRDRLARHLATMDREAIIAIALSHCDMIDAAIVYIDQLEQRQADLKALALKIEDLALSTLRTRNLILEKIKLAREHLRGGKIVPGRGMLDAILELVPPTFESIITPDVLVDPPRFYVVAQQDETQGSSL